MKLIAITPDYEKNLDKFMINKAYMDMVFDNGAVPVLIPALEKYEDILKIIDKFDGFIISGGADVSPKYYGEDKLIKCGEVLEIRDKLEFELIKLLHEKDIPTFAICRGLQMMNVALGGTLYQDLSYIENVKIKHSPSELDWSLVHSVENQNDTFFEKILGKEEFFVNSFHHQAIKDLASDLQVGQVSKDGIIEGVFDPKKSFFVGVQWHPEKCYRQVKQAEILFKNFLEKC